METSLTAAARSRRQQQYPPLDLGHSVRLVKERLAPPKVGYHGVSFHLDTTSLRLIQLARSRDQKLFISPRFLADLRRYILLNSEQQLQTDLTFSTCFQFGEHERTILQTIIALDGDIFHKITAECLADGQFAQDVTQAHYWLIQQLMVRLQLGFRQFLNHLSWSLSLLLTGGWWWSQWQSVWRVQWQTQLLEMVLTLASAWLLQVVLRQSLQIFVPYIRKQIMRQIFQTSATDLPGQPRIWQWLERIG